MYHKIEVEKAKPIDLPIPRQDQIPIYYSWVCRDGLWDWKIGDIYSRETPTAHCGPNTVSVYHLKGWCSTIRLGPDTEKHFASAEVVRSQSNWDCKTNLHLVELELAIQQSTGLELLCHHAHQTYNNTHTSAQESTCTWTHTKKQGLMTNIRLLLVTVDILRLTLGKWSSSTEKKGYVHKK